MAAPALLVFDEEAALDVDVPELDEEDSEDFVPALVEKADSETADVLDGKTDSTDTELDETTVSERIVGLETAAVVSDPVIMAVDGEEVVVAATKAVEATAASEPKPGKKLGE